MTAAVNHTLKRSERRNAAREDRLTRAFRISGAIAIASLVTLAAFRLPGMLSLAAWSVSGVALTACLRIAWLMRDSERGARVFDALWLRSADSTHIDPAGGGDGDGD